MINLQAKALTIAQMKEAEARSNELGVSYAQLMENAGSACTAKIKELFPKLSTSSVVILCGKGNNGGDGLVIARKLENSAADITCIFCCGEPGTELSQKVYQQAAAISSIQFLDAKKEPMLCHFCLNQADLIIDCIFGTGFHGEVQGSAQPMIGTANKADAVRIAVDIPSGMNGDDGSCSISVFRADHTLALGALKPAHLLEDTQSVCGKIHTLDIGMPSEALEDSSSVKLLKWENLPALLPKRDPNANKGDFGKLLILAGRSGMGGAAMMATLSALRCGCGLTTLAAASSVINACFPHLMDAVTLSLAETKDGAVSSESLTLLSEHLSSSTAAVIGCGLGHDEHTEKLVRSLVKETQTPLVIDADGINCLAGDINIVQTAKAPIILTPHPKEFSRICGKSVAEIEADREQAASQFAQQYSVHLVLKGHATVIALPDGTVYQNTTGNAGMAKGGSGDVLAGMIGSFLAQGIASEKAACLAVCLHGACGDRCAQRLSEYGILARDLIQEIPLLLRELEQNR